MPTDDSPTSVPPPLGEEHPLEGEETGQSSIEADRAAAEGEDVDTDYTPEASSEEADEQRLERGAE